MLSEARDIFNRYIIRYGIRDCTLVTEYDNASDFKVDYLGRVTQDFRQVQISLNHIRQAEAGLRLDVCSQPYDSENLLERIIAHEVGHILHGRTAGIHTLGSMQNPINRYVREYLRRKIGRYASTCFTELVAEVFANLNTGIPVDSKIIKLYKVIGGPDIIFDNPVTENICMISREEISSLIKRVKR